VLTCKEEFGNLRSGVIKITKKASPAGTTINTSWSFTSRKPMCAECALLHNMFLMDRYLRITKSMSNRIGRFLPVKTSDSCVGAGCNTHPAANALIIILDYYSIFLAFIRSTHWANTCTRRVLAVLASQGDKTQRNIGVDTSCRIHALAANGESPVPPILIR
jgi:hypothetical protein